jgi:hypothetical protein
MTLTLLGGTRSSPEQNIRLETEYGQKGEAGTLGPEGFCVWRSDRLDMTVGYQA